LAVADFYLIFVEISTQNNSRDFKVTINTSNKITEDLVLEDLIYKNVCEFLQKNSSVKAEIVKINDKNQFKSLFQRDIRQFSNILLGSSIMAGKFSKNIEKFLLDEGGMNEELQWARRHVPHDQEQLTEQGQAGGLCEVHRRPTKGRDSCGVCSGLAPA
jgi:hypothetical protein